MFIRSLVVDCPFFVVVERFRFDLILGFDSFSPPVQDMQEKREYLLLTL